MLSGSAGEAPTDYPTLLDLLGSRPQPALVFYGRDDSRVELSGRVLTNWAVKLIGLFGEEYELGPEDEVLVDASPHWKAAAVVLAVGAMGARAAMESGGRPEAVITDRPAAWVGSAELGEAELAALSPGMLDSSYEEAVGEPIPAWVLDISAEARQQPDQLLAPLPQTPLPSPASTSAGPLVLTSWDAASPALMTGTWAGGGLVVLFEGEPAGERWERMRRNEGLA